MLKVPPGGGTFLHQKARETVHRQRPKRPRRRSQAGFTLVELLVVIAVLATLATIVVLNIAGVQGHGSTSACKTDLQSVQTAANAYYVDHSNAWPSSLDQLVPGYLHTEP